MGPRAQTSNTRCHPPPTLYSPACSTVNNSPPAMRAATSSPSPASPKPTATSRRKHSPVACPSWPTSTPRQHCSCATARTADSHRSMNQRRSRLGRWHCSRTCLACVQCASQREPARNPSTGKASCKGSNRSTPPPSTAPRSHCGQGRSCQGSRHGHIDGSGQAQVKEARGRQRRPLWALNSRRSPSARFGQTERAWSVLEAGSAAGPGLPSPHTRERFEEVGATPSRTRRRIIRISTQAKTKAPNALINQTSGTPIACSAV